MNRFFVKMQLYQVEALYDRAMKVIDNFLNKAKEKGLNIKIVENEKDIENEAKSFITTP